MTIWIDRALGAARRLLPIVAAVALLAPASLLASARAADVLTLTDGTVYEGEITRETGGWVYFRYSVGGIEREQLFRPDQIQSLARAADDIPAPAPEQVDAPRADRVVPESKPRVMRDDVPRIAVLSLGEGGDRNMVGVYMTAHSVRQTIPILEKAGVTDVVFRVNSGGGLLLELQRMSDVIHREFKPRFRTVAWIDSAISAAAMSVHCVEEIYFMPQGAYGACTGWHGQLTAVKGRDLDSVLFQMEKISERGGHDYKLMRSMQIMEPLSVTKDANGDVQFFQDLSGEMILNPDNRILTLNAAQAEQIEFSSGTAATVDELARLMGYSEFEVVGKAREGWAYPVSEAEDFLIDFRARVAVDDRRTQQYLTLWEQSMNMARGAGPDRRGPFVGKARKALRDIERMVRNNPNLALLRLNLTTEEAIEDWIEEREEELRELGRDNA
ncbi:MAG: hypothetical protein AAGK04_07685 [Planctomycetota bacterium]